MAAHPIFKGTIRFKKHRVPVKLFAAARKERLGFRLLHEPDRERLEQRMCCTEENKPVGRDHQALGYEVARGQYVMLDREEVKAARPQTDREINVVDVAGGAEIDPRLYDRPYYLGPDGDDGAYALLARALSRSGRVAICRWAMRGRAHIGVLRPLGDLLLLTTMRYAHELVPTDTLAIERRKVKKAELQTAKQLIEQLSSDFDPSAYRNEHQQALLDLIERKAKGGKAKTSRPRRKRPTSPDQLQEMLEKSVERAKAA